MDVVKKLADTLDTIVAFLLGETEDMELLKDPDMLKRLNDINNLILKHDAEGITWNGTKGIFSLDENKSVSTVGPELSSSNPIELKLLALEPDPVFKLAPPLYAQGFPNAPL